MTNIRIRFALGAFLLALPSCTMFDTDVKNPNAIEEGSLTDPAGAPMLANGLNSAVTRMITSVYGPISVASDELTWVGSREYWGKLDAGDVSDPRNEYADAAFAMAGEARWLSHYTISKLEAFDATVPTSLVNRGDLARAYISGAIAWITVADNFDDFVIGSDRTVPTAPLGEANMGQAYDSAVAYLDKALPIAVSIANAEYQRQIYGLRARAKYQKAVFNMLKPARTTPGAPLVNDAGANADALSAIGLMATGYRYRLLATTANTGTNNIASEMNSRQEVRAGDAYINPTANNLQPLAGTAGIKLNDPITGTFDPNINAAINECCRSTVATPTLIPFTQTSWDEMQLILAEAAIAGNGGVGTAQSRINLVRANDAVTAWDGVTPAPLAMLQHERRVNLFLQSRRLADMFRFGLKDTKWLTGNILFTKACFFPITQIERQANLLAPQPIDARPASCTP